MARRHREVLDVLLDRIVDGRYAAGAMLPKEELLKQEFEVSRGTGREALRALEERRVAIVKHGSGATVQPPEEWNVLDGAVAAALARGRRRRAFLDEVSELRGVLEPLAAGLAAERASGRQRAALRTAGTRLAESDDVARDVRRVRRLIAAAAGSRPLASTLRALWEARQPSLPPDAAERLKAVSEAIGEGDVEAARAAARRVL